MTKVLVSRGFGAGWATWSDKPKEVAEYLPIIEFIEAGGNPDDLESTDHNDAGDVIYHPLVQQMLVDLELGDYFYTGGAGGLTVQETDGRYRINDYDGNESLETEDSFW